MQDKIEIIGTNTVIQHGELNKRVYLIKLDERDVNNITSLLNVLARERSYSKIFCKVPAWAAPVFNADGFIMEAFIPRFYAGSQGVCFMSKFLNSDRLLGIENDALKDFSKMLGAFRAEEADAPGEKVQEKESPEDNTGQSPRASIASRVARAARAVTTTRPGTVSEGASTESENNPSTHSRESVVKEFDGGQEDQPAWHEADAATIKEGPGVDILGEEEADEISEIYKRVFKSYPFPIHDPNYIRKTMREHIRYFGIRANGNLIALSSAEMDVNAANAEMTDFATLPEARGKRTAYYLLRAMEAEMRQTGLKTLYTIARLNSLPMNKTFLKHGYIYSGTLINNTNIDGSIESMNVLYKHIN